MSSLEFGGAADRRYTTRILSIVALLAIVGLLIAAPLAAPAAAAQTADNSTSTYTLEELRKPGVHDEESPSSYRMLPDGSYIGIKTYPPNPTAPTWKYVDPDQTIRSDRLTLYPNRNGRAEPVEAEFVVVYYRVSNGSAVNQTIQRTRITLGPGYSEIPITLRSFYDEPVKMSMWLEMDGDGDGELEPVDGVRWAGLGHRSMPGGQALTNPLATKADAWEWGFWTIVIPGVVAVVLAYLAARRVLERAGTGPRIPLGTWVFWSFWGVLGAIGLAFYQLSAILANLPWVLGGVIGVVAFIVMMFLGTDVERIAIIKDELVDARPLRNSDLAHDRRERLAELAEDVPGENPVTDGGEAVASAEELEEPEGATTADVALENEEDGSEPEAEDEEDGSEPEAEDESAIDLGHIDPGEYKDSLYQRMRIFAVIKDASGNYAIVPKGLRPFIARIFAEPAVLDVRQVRTRIEATGSVNRVYLADPESPDVLEKYDPAGLELSPPLLEDVDEELEPDERPGLLERVNWNYLVNSTLALGLGWILGTAINVPNLGLGIGGLAVLAMSIKATPGEIEFNPAPIHMTSAKATLTALQREYSDAKTLEEYERIAWNERTRTALEERETQRRFDETISERLNDISLGGLVDRLRRVQE